MTPATRLRATDSLERCPAAADKISFMGAPSDRESEPASRPVQQQYRPRPYNHKKKNRRKKMCTLEGHSAAQCATVHGRAVLVCGRSVALDGAFVLYGCVL